MSKIYAGGRLRRLREERGLYQADLAKILKISPSYLNQMEHDTRPLTVPVLLRLTESFGLDPEFFSERDASRLLADLRETLADELDRAVLSPADLKDLAGRLPHVAALLLDLGRRNRTLTERLAEFTGSRGGTTAPDTARTPHEEIREFFYRRRNYLHDADRAAEDLAHEIGIRPGEVRRALATHLDEHHDVRITTDADDRLHRYDPRARILHLSPRLRPGQQAFRMATQIALLEHDDLIRAYAS
ncbi:MAG TPA: helix-turn-helix domain-containing protein, partial [Glycomyces sp.]|nr:helix-turn-helix domain-containing protein [Glycomyces sp.]